jgi:hypothetical protein
METIATPAPVLPSSASNPTNNVSSAARITVADSLLKEGLINGEQYNLAIEDYKRTKRSLVMILMEAGALNDQKRVDFLARKTQCEVVRLKDVIPSMDVAGIIDREHCRRLHLVPLRRDNGRVMVAMLDPTDLRVVSDLERLFNAGIRPVLATSAEISETIERLPLDKDAPTADTPGVGYAIVSLFSLGLLTLGPMAASYYYVFFNAVGSEWFEGFKLDTVSRAIVLMVGWGSWAAFAYFLNDLIFGRSSNSV